MNQDDEQVESKEISPVDTVFKYLESFSDHSQDSSGDIRQDCPVESGVLEALAKIFHTLVSDKGVTLDAAFGGKFKRQLQQIRSDKDAHEVAFEIAVAMQGGSSYEKATDDVAKELNISPDTVHDRYKRSGSNGPRKRGGKSKKIHPAI